jgi:Fe-S cluster assembly protein SufB
VTSKQYAYGFSTLLEADTLPVGLNEEIIREISRKKSEPAWLLDFRLNAFSVWKKLKEPEWGNFKKETLDFQSICYYSAPKKKPTMDKLEDADPELLKTFERLGIPLAEQAALANVAMDVVFDSVSVSTSFQEKLQDVEVIFCPLSEAVQKYPDLVREYLASVVPVADSFYSALNSAVFSDGSFVYIPKGVKCPLDLSTYFRINERTLGQFERTLIIAEEGAYVSYLEGCTAPAYDTNQLHAAVVELVAHESAEIKY